MHGHGSHSTEECDTIKKQVKRLKSNNNNNNSKSGDDKKSGDWKKKAGDAKDKAKDQFATFITETVDKAVKKATASKKRKSDDESSEGTLAAFEELNIEDFDYDERENIVVDDDGKSASC